METVKHSMMSKFWLQSGENKFVEETHKRLYLEIYRNILYECEQPCALVPGIEVQRWDIYLLKYLQFQKLQVRGKCSKVLLIHCFYLFRCLTTYMASLEILHCLEFFFHAAT